MVQLHGVELTQQHRNAGFFGNAAVDLILQIEGDLCLI